MESNPMIDSFVVVGVSPRLTVSDVFIPTQSPKPITDIALVNLIENEKCPPGYEIITETVSGACASLTHSSGLRPRQMFLCFKRGFEKPPLCDVGVLYEHKDVPLDDVSVIRETVDGHCANVNAAQPGSTRIFLTYRRASFSNGQNNLPAVRDVLIILKGDHVPHTYNLVNKALNRSLLGGSDLFICYKKAFISYSRVQCAPLLLHGLKSSLSANDCAIPEKVASFCFPQNAAVEINKRDLCLVIFLFKMRGIHDQYWFKGQKFEANGSAFFCASLY
ncbi:hypothetical protein ACOME3_006836 [Neoechinorhynchus agilis]